MGTEITLELAGITLSYSKNNMGPDHGALFQETDRNRICSDQINYEYFEENGEDPASMEMAFTRKLKVVLPRLNLLGFTIDQARIEYELVTKQYRTYISSIEDEIMPPLDDLMSFDEFRTFIAAHAIKTLSDVFVYDSEKRNELIKGRFANDPLVKRIPSFCYDNAYSERSYFFSLVNIIHPYSLLHVFAENLQNREAEIVWHYGPLVENGWVDALEFIPNARRTQTFLIATEGSSDVHILKHALQILHPDIADFFRFIDVSESHPFSGTGSLVKFAEGLAKIEVQNQTVFIFDNDAEGYDACQKVRKFALPSNMRAIILPELEEFRSFPARGPNGIKHADINKRAAAIECYLDLNFIGIQTPYIVWTNYKKDRDVYQGALENKEAHYKAFLKKAAPEIVNGRYDVSKLKIVLDALITECISIAIASCQAED